MNWKSCRIHGSTKHHPTQILWKEDKDLHGSLLSSYSLKAGIWARFGQLLRKYKLDGLIGPILTGFQPNPVGISRQALEVLNIWNLYGNNQEKILLFTSAFSKKTFFAFLLFVSHCFSLLGINIWDHCVDVPLYDYACRLKLIDYLHYCMDADIRARFAVVSGCLHARGEKEI